MGTTNTPLSAGSARTTTRGAPNTFGGPPPSTGRITPPAVGPSPFPNQQVAPLTPQQQQSMSLVGSETGPTQGFLNNAIANQNATLGGAFLGTENPFLAQYFNAAAQPMIQNYEQAVAPNILQQAAAGGDLGSSGMNQAFSNAEQGLAQGLGNLGAGIYEPAYAQERGIMQQAAQGAPNVAAGAYIPSQELMQSGNVAQSQAQHVLDTAYQNLYGKANYPFQALQQLGSALSPAAGPTLTGSSSQPGFGSMK